MQSITKKVSRGFTLLELIIVIAILAILAAVVIIVLNPAETLKQARDSQRLSDLSTLKSAISLYLTTITTPDLDEGSSGGNTVCFSNPAGGANGAQIAYSSSTPAVCADATTNPQEGADVTTGGTAIFNATDNCLGASATVGSATDGTGWIPVNLNRITGGSPLSNLPIDPTNTVTTATDPNFTDLVYRYSCQNDTTVVGKNSYLFEVDATLESSKYGGAAATGLDTTDGGDEDALYEVGNSVRLMGNSDNTAGTDY